MSIKIHHGPNGAYKTSGAIQDDAVPALKQGRLIITNVRGFTVERVMAAMPELPGTVDIINLDLESLADMERMRTWFQWAPRGAFIIFDETQLVFPKTWREKDLERFEFPGGPEEVAKADRPMSWLDGWTRHRHWNWDIVLTTPNISYIRDDIRMTCEMAYKHSNLAVIGIGGRYKEAQHDAQLNRAPMEGTVIEYKKIKPITFKLYLSTSTGITQDTKAGKSLLRSPKLLFLLVFIAGLFVAVLSLGGINLGPVAANKAPGPERSTAAVVASPVSDVAANPLRFRDVADEPATAIPAQLNHPYAPRTFAIRAVLEGTFGEQHKQLGWLDVLDEDGNVIRQSFSDLAKLGYHLTVRNSCLLDISHPLGFKGVALCPGRPNQTDDSGKRIDIAGIAIGPLKAAQTAHEAPKQPRQTLTIVADSQRAEKP